MGLTRQVGEFQEVVWAKKRTDFVSNLWGVLRGGPGTTSDTTRWVKAVLTTKASQSKVVEGRVEVAGNVVLTRYLKNSRQRDVQVIFKSRWRATRWTQRGYLGERSMVRGPLLKNGVGSGFPFCGPDEMIYLIMVESVF